ncbi:MAG: hypothetical protein WEB56_15600 [Roseovarius sp.]
MNQRALNHVRAVQDRLARLRALRLITRDSPDKLRRDAAIIAYSRTLDSLVEDLTALDEMGLLSACLRRLGSRTQEFGALAAGAHALDAEGQDAHPKAGD